MLEKEVLNFEKTAIVGIVTQNQSEDKLTEYLDELEFLTATAGGFYGPQGRVLRLAIQDEELNSKMDNFNFNGVKIANFEMETSAIFGLAKLMGHEAISLNAVIANRVLGTFSKNPGTVIKNLIIYTLNKIT